MDLFWVIYASVSVGFLAGAATYLWRWKRPVQRETRVEYKTRVECPPPQIRYLHTGPKIVRCCECKHYGFQEVDGDLRLRCQWHNRDSMPQAFCSAGERKEG